MYKDRGIIKWAPFDALVGFHQLINDLVYQKNKIEHPILLEDKLEELDQLFMEVLSYKLEATYKYYHDGYIKETFGFIISFDKLKRILKLDNSLSIHLDDITYIKKLD